MASVVYPCKALQSQKDHCSGQDTELRVRRTICAQMMGGRHSWSCTPETNRNGARWMSYLKRRGNWKLIFTYTVSCIIVEERENAICGVVHHISVTKSCKTRDTSHGLFSARSCNDDICRGYIDKGVFGDTLSREQRVMAAFAIERPICLSTFAAVDGNFGLRLVTTVVSR